MNNMAVVNVNNLLNIKDSRWLQLEVCREFQRNKCSRPDTECKFAHPPANVEVQNGRVTACYDSIKGRCNREKPPCKYFHPPPHLKDQLLINGRNHLALKNALMQQMGLAPGQPVVPGQVPAVATNPYLAGVTSQAYNPYFAAGPLVPLVTSDPTGAAVVSPLGVPQQTVVAQQKVPRADRLELKYGFIGNGLLGSKPTKICISRNACSPNSTIEIIEEFSQPNSPGPREFRSTFSSLFGPQYKLTVQEKNVMRNKLVSYPGMVAYKRPAGDKSGVPVYQPANTPSAAAYQQLMQLQQPFVPVSSTSIQHSNATMTTASSANSMGGITTATSVQDHSNNGGLANGSLDSHGNDAGIKRINKQESENESGDLHDGSSSLNLNNTGNDLDEEAKAESANKRMRVQNVGSGGQANVSQVPNPMGQNNAAYVAAAQSYHNALAAMTYTGVALQTNKAQQQQASAPPQSHGYPGSAAAAAAAAAAFQQQHQGFQSQQSQQQQQQQSQQQQLLSQYQAMAAAAALANQGSFQGGAYASHNQQASNSANQQSANNAAAAAALNMNMNAASAAAGLNPFAAAAAMNPLLAASIPQFAAAQRAGLLANQQQGQQALQSAQFNPAALAAAGLPTGQSGANPGAGMAAFNPFGVQFAAGPAGGSSANALQFQGNQQALLAAYGQFARAPVPVAAVSAAPTLTTQQIYVGNPAAAAAAAAAAAGSGALQAGVKRLRPQ